MRRRGVFSRKLAEGKNEKGEKYAKPRRKVTCYGRRKRRRRVGSGRREIRSPEKKKGRVCFSL